MKKNIIFISLISLSYIYSCTTQNTNNPPFISPSSTVDNNNKPNTSISPNPTQPPISIFDIPSYSQNGDLTIKDFLGINNINSNYDDFFKNILEDVNSLVIKDNDLYVSSFKNVLTKYSLSNLKVDYSYKCSNLSPAKVLYNDSYESNDNLIQSNINKLKDYCHISSRLEIGKDNKIYISSNSKISEITTDNKIVDIYEFKANDKVISSTIRVDKSSNIYFITNDGIKKINSRGEKIWTKNIIINKENEYNYIDNIAIDNNDNIYFLDKSSTINKIDSSGNISKIIGGGESESFNQSPLNYNLNGSNINIVIDKKNSLYILENSKNRILKYNEQTSSLELFSGNNIPSSNNDNKKSSQIYLNKPFYINFDESNNAYILDSGNKVIRKVDNNTGISSIILGNHLNHGDGNDLSKTFFNSISSIYFKNKSLFISENDRIRKIDRYNNISTIAGNTSPISVPTGMPTIDSESYNNVQANQVPVSYAKILYISNDNKIYIKENQKIRVISNDNRISDFSLKDYNINSITQDSKGNSFFADNKIYKIDKNNNIEVFAGKDSKYRYDTYKGVIPPPSFDEESIRKDIKVGDNAKEIYFLEAQNIVIDNQDNIYAVVTYAYDLFNHRDKYYSIIRINPQGIVDKVYSDVNKPENLIIDKENNIYFTDKYLHTYYSYNIIKKADGNNKTFLYAGKLLYNNENLPNNSINDIKALDAIFKEGQFYITGLTLDDNNRVYFSTIDNKIYRIE